MAIEQFIKNTIDTHFRKYFYDELVIGKLAHTDFKTGVKKGDEVDVVMPSLVTLSDFDGSELANPEMATTSIAKVKINKGKSFHFEIDEVKEAQIKNAKDNDEKLRLATEYAQDATKQFSAGVDKAYGDLYTRAGHYLSGSSDAAITLDASYAKEILAYMQAEFKRGDKNGHTNWVDGQMIAIVPPEYQFYLGQLDDFKYVESGHKKMEKGFIGKLCGWDILVSNNIASPSSGVYYPLFGYRGKTLAGGVSKDLNTMSYIPDKKFNTCYKGYGMFGVGAPRADFLGTVKVSAPLQLSTRT